MFTQKEITEELSRVEHRATDIVKDRFGSNMLFEIRYEDEKERVFNTFGNLLVSPLPIKQFSRKERGIGNHYRNQGIEHIVTLDPIILHLFNLSTKTYHTKQVEPLSRIIIPPKIAHAVYAKPGARIIEQCALYNPEDIFYYPIINLKTGKRII
jgi:hypothetical protein